MHGHGIHEWGDGDRYVGEMVDGKKSGWGM